MEKINLKPGSLDYNTLKKIANNEVTIELAHESHEKIDQSVFVVKKLLDSDETVYGINTGFGRLANTKIDAEHIERLQKNLILSHASGVGTPLDSEVVRLMLALKINNLAQGHSGIRRSVIDLLIKAYNCQVYPLIPSKGSVGASGDLVPLAHMVAPFLGEGAFLIENEKASIEEGFKQLGLESPLRLAAKEGLALINGMQASTALTLAAVIKAESVFKSALIAGSLSLEAAKGSVKPFDLKIHQVRRHSAQIQVASIIRTLLEGSEIVASHKGCAKVQDPYSLRCQPQVMGACLHQLNFVKETLVDEANAITDNPLVFSETEEVLSGGNFHGEIVAMGADNLAIALAEIGALSERRISLLMDEQLSGLPPFLIEDSGVNSGFMIAHVTASACASENKALSHPHVVDSLPTSANQEDHVSMAMNGALRLFKILDNIETIVAIELLAACQGLEFLRPLKSSLRLEEAFDKVRSQVPKLTQDRYFADDIDKIKTLISKDVFGEFISL